MRSLTLAVAIGALSVGSPLAAPLVAHRAAYDLSLTDPFSGDKKQKTSEAVGARGLIGYEFRGTECEGYTSHFRLAADIDQSEGGAIKIGQRSTTFEEPNGVGYRFQIEDLANDKVSTIAGYASRGVGGDLAVDLKKPAADHAVLGKEILFPSEHIARLIAAAESGETKFEARVYDGSDSGTKIFQTLSIIGKKQSADSRDAAKALQGHARWPVTVSYFDAARKDGAADYVMAFDLYDNGVTGDLKIDYGGFAIAGTLASLEMLPQRACKN